MEIDERLFTAFHQKDTLLGLLGKKPRRITELTSHIDEETLTTMYENGLMDFWFIALKRHFPREIFRLYEMNQFLAFYSTFVSTRPGWLDECLNLVYREILTEIDETIFYPETFVKRHFHTIDDKVVAINTGAYFSQFVCDGADKKQVLFTRIIDPVQDGAILNDMTLRSLGEHYRKKGKYHCISQFSEELDEYKMKHIKARATLYYTVVALYKWLRAVYATGAHESADRHEAEISAIRKLFQGIRDEVKKGDLSTHTVLINRLPKTIKDAGDAGLVKKNVLETIKQKYDAFSNELHYSGLFEDSQSDSELRVSRDKYRWLLPFNEALFRANKNDTNDNIEREVMMIMIQECMLWINLVIYEEHVISVHKLLKKQARDAKKSKADADSSTKKKKKKTDADSEEEKRVNKKRKTQVGRSILIEQQDKSHLLSILKGAGVLTIYYMSHNQSESYQINTGDNIELPLDMKEYHILYNKM